MSSNNETNLPLPPKSMFDFVFFQLVYMNLLETASIILLIKFQIVFHKGRTKLSTQLRIHIMCWIIALCFSIIYTGPYLVMKCLYPAAQRYNLFWAVMRGTLHFSAVSTICLSTSFIAIDRIFILIFPTRSNSRIKYYIHVLSIVTVVTNFVVMFYMGVERSYSFATDSTTECLAVNCLVHGKIKDLVLYKMFISWANLALGALFIYLFFSYGRKTTVRREKKKNLLVLNILISELCFAIIPATSYLIVDYVAGTILATILNTIISISYATDGFANAVFYWKTWKERNVKTKIRTIMPIRVSTGVFLNTSNPS